MESLQGHLLVASPSLLDPNFARTIVLIVQHGDGGAMGLVLNRPLEMTIREACEQALEATCDSDDPLHLGGPCQGPLMVLHTIASEADLDVLPGLYFTVEKDKLERLLAGAAEAERVRWFVGHSGWSAGQLESELETGSWLTAPAELEQIFDPDMKLWFRLISKLTVGRWIDPEQMPDDPSLN
jgi:putative transcriptional regulator